MLNSIHQQSTIKRLLPRFVSEDVTFLLGCGCVNPMSSWKYPLRLNTLQSSDAMSRQRARKSTMKVRCGCFNSEIHSSWEVRPWWSKSRCPSDVPNGCVVGVSQQVEEKTWGGRNSTKHTTLRHQKSRQAAGHAMASRVISCTPNSESKSRLTIWTLLAWLVT